jgi:alkylation response protein AidB-like acyl-CoA dehydrogenase
MDYSIPAATERLLTDVRGFLDAQVLPLEPLFLAGDWNALAPRLEDCREAVRTHGWWAPNLPQSAGGLGLELVELGLVSEVLGRTPLGHYVFGCQAPDAGNAELLLLYGDDGLRERYLLPLAAGRVRSCFCMTEPEFAGSNPVEMGTTAVRDGDEWVINGHKWFATAAEGAAFAIVMAVTDPDAPPHARASMILVDCDTPGFELVRNIPVMGHAGHGPFSHGEVRLRDCRVPAGRLLGEPGAGFLMAQQRLGPGRVHHCMRWLGICARAIDLMCEHAARRELSPGQPLARQQIVQAWIAESAAEAAAARGLVLETAWRIEREGWKAAREMISMIKFLTANTLQRIVDRAVQVHGALGVTDDTVLAFFYREERAARIYDGPDEVHKLSVARRLLKQRAAAG